MKNQSLYDAFDIVFPPVPAYGADSEVTIPVDGVNVMMNHAGVAAYRNEYAKGDAFRKAILLGINALSYDGNEGLEPLPYASVAYSKNQAFSVYFERDHSSVLAYLQGARAVSLCVTPPIPEALLRNDQSWDFYDLTHLSQASKQ